METLDFSVENAVGWIRLTRPEIHNPLDVPLRTDCWRQFKIDHLCQLNFDQGSNAGCVAPGCG